MLLEVYIIDDWFGVAAYSEEDALHLYTVYTGQYGKVTDRRKLSRGIALSGVAGLDFVQGG